MCVIRLIHLRGMARSCAWHDSFTCVTWLIYMCGGLRGVTAASRAEPSCVWHDSFTRVAKPYLYAWHDVFIRVTWLIYMCDMTHLHVWRSLWCSCRFSRRAFICVTWLIQTCDTLFLCAWHALFIRVTRLIYMSDMTHSYMQRSSWCSCHFSRWDFICVTRLVRMCDTPHLYAWHDLFIYVPLLIYKCDINL